MKLSLGCFFRMEYLEARANFVIDSIFGSYCIEALVQCCWADSKYNNPYFIENVSAKIISGLDFLLCIRGTSLPTPKVTP